MPGGVHPMDAENMDDNFTIVLNSHAKNPLPEKFLIWVRARRYV